MFKEVRWDMIKVLVVEDDPEIAMIIQYNLVQDESYELTWASNATDALMKSRDDFDIILMDVMLPEMSGIDLCEKIRQYHHCPIIFISCLDDNDTIISALEKGGDDFIVKPFDNKLLDAKIKANLRRVEMDRKEVSNFLECESFRLDAQTHTVVKKNGERFALVQMEFYILSFLMQNPNRCFKAGELYKYIWGKPSMGDNRTVVVHIHNLRKKIEEDNANPRYIKSIWGKGYLFDPSGRIESN